MCQYEANDSRAKLEYCLNYQIDLNGDDKHSIIKKSDYYRKLFVDSDLNRATRNSIKDFLKNPEDYLVLMGTCGSGKTSLIYKMLNEMEDECEVLKIDFKRIGIETTTIHDDAIVAEMSYEKQLREEIRLKYFSESKNDPDLIRKRQILFSLHHISDYKNENLQVYRSEMENNNASIENIAGFIENNSDRLREVMQYFSKVFNETRLGLIINYIREAFLDEKNFLLFLDNIDLVHIENQRHLLNYCVKLHFEKMRKIPLLVTIREDSATAVFLQSGIENNLIRLIGFDPSRHLSDPDSFSEKAFAKKAPMLRMTKEISAIYQEIVQKRIAHFKEYFDSRKHEIPSNKNAEYSDDQIRLFLYQNIKDLNARVSNCISDDDIYRTANNSLSLMLCVNSEFLEYLIGHASSYYKTLSGAQSFIHSKSIYEMRSHFFRWIVRYQRTYHIRFTGVLDNYKSFENNPHSNPFDTDASIMILSWLYNNRSLIEAHKLKNAMERIGIDDEIVKNNIAWLRNNSHLYSLVEEYRNYSKANSLIRITTLGIQLIKYTLEKYEYFQALLEEEKALSFHPKNPINVTTSSVEIVIEWLTKIANVHSKQLNITKEKLRTEYKDRWIEFVRRNYCIDNYFTIERVTMSHIGYLNDKLSSEEFNHVKELYSKMLEAFYQFSDISDETSRTLLKRFR